MLFWLKKVVGYWLMPMPFSLLLIVVGVVMIRLTTRRRLGRGLILAGGAWLLVCTNSGIGTWMIRQFEGRYASQPAFLNGETLPRELARTEFITVLGGGHTYVPNWPATNQLSPSALARIVEGVRLAHGVPHARLIVSGPVNERVGGPTHARMLADAAVSLGIARERIIEIDTARDTEEEAATIHALAGDRPVALVTSAWHLPRAMALCQRQGIDAIACPSDYTAQTDRAIKSDFYKWNLGGLERSTKAVYEFIGTTWARLRGKA